MTIYSGFSHEKWWFSIVMLVYQRVGLYPSPTNQCSSPLRIDSQWSPHQKAVLVISRDENTMINESWSSEPPVAPCQLWQWLSVVSVGFQTMTYSMTISSGSSGFTNEIRIWDTHGYPSNTVKRSKPQAVPCNVLFHSLPHQNVRNTQHLSPPLAAGDASRRAIWSSDVPVGSCWYVDLQPICLLLKLCPN
jgi:hypothetical protein